MSTKIFNGYTLGNKTFSQVHRFVQKVRKKMEEKRKELYLQLTAEIVTDLVDDIFLLPLDKVEKRFNSRFESAIRKSPNATFDSKDSVQSLVFRGVRRGVEASKHVVERLDEFDLNASLVLIPLPQKVLAMFFAERKEFREVWRSFSEVKEYRYWNNTDPDENVSKEEWEQRRKDWNKALPGVGVPSENGFVVEFFPNLPLVTVVDALPYGVSYEKRVHFRAKENVLNQKMSELYEVNEKSLFGAFEKAHEWFKTDEGQKVFKEEKERIAALIPKEITQDILQMKISELFENKERFL